jgi:hypothetical protein
MDIKLRGSLGSSIQDNHQAKALPCGPIFSWCDHFNQTFYFFFTVVFVALFVAFVFAPRTVVPAE